MRILQAYNLGGRASWIWDEDARMWWLCEWIGWCDAVILCRRDYHAEAAMIATSQGGCDRTCVGFELIFDTVEFLICIFLVNFG